MIVLTCTNCRARLEMDDAFAGGVCRCMYCGTIQTVPSHLKRPGAPNQVKTIYQTQPRTRTNGTGNGDAAADASGELDQLAQVVATSGSSSGSGLAGSGLTGSGLRAASERPAPRVRVATFAPPESKWKRHRVLIVGAFGAIVALGALGLFVANRANSRPVGTTPAVSPGAQPVSVSSPQPPRVEPNFCGVSLKDEAVVVYVLDRGSATAELFGDLKDACYRSVESLGPQRKFQIIFWDNGTSDASYPPAGPAPATPEHRDAARQALEPVCAHGRSDPGAALSKAFACDPSAVVLVTAKAYELDDAFVASVQKARGSRRARVHTVALGSSDSTGALKKLATSTGAEFRAVSAAKLREHAQ